MVVVLVVVIFVAVVLVVVVVVIVEVVFKIIVKVVVDQWSKILLLDLCFSSFTKCLLEVSDFMWYCQKDYSALECELFKEHFPLCV